MDHVIRFGGAAAVSAALPAADIPGLPSTPEEFQSRYAAQIAQRPPWVRMLEQAFLQLCSTPEGKEEFGDPDRGATLPQAWNTSVAIGGMFSVCLLARGRPTVPTGNIANVILISPAALGTILSKGFATIAGFTAQLFVYDGRMGHCIVVIAHDSDRGRFQYHDPWPDRSLLCREFNLAGVDAQPAPDGLWEITGHELESVIFAAFVMPTFWADLTGNNYRVAYEALRQGHFFAFFNLHETERATEESGRIRIRLKPGGSQESVYLEITSDAAGAVRAGTLSLRRPWIVSEATGLNPFAVDISVSFLSALMPGPDRSSDAARIQALSHLRDRAALDALRSRCANSSLTIGDELLLTFLGIEKESIDLLTFCRIEANHVQREDLWLQIEITLY